MAVTTVTYLIQLQITTIIFNKLDHLDKCRKEAYELEALVDTGSYFYNCKLGM